MPEMLIGKPAVLPMQQLRVERDLSGGAKLQIGDKAALLSPEQAVQVATALLGAVGIKAEFSGNGKPVIHAPRLQG